MTSFGDQVLNMRLPCSRNGGLTLNGRSMAGHWTCIACVELGFFFLFVFFVCFFLFLFVFVCFVYFILFWLTLLLGFVLILELLLMLLVGVVFFVSHTDTQTTSTLSQPTQE